MTRKITLQLASDTTETHCGVCASCTIRPNEGFRCGAYGKALSFDECTKDTLRLPECVAAEAERAALVRDAALGAAVRSVWDRNMSTFGQPLGDDIIQAIAAELRERGE